MALADALTSTTRPPAATDIGAPPSWNPLRCGGTALPPGLLMAAKAIALLLIPLHYVDRVRPPHLPLFGWPYGLPELPTQRMMQGLMLLAILGLTFNRFVRACCVALGLTLLSTVLFDRASYANAKIFAVLLLLFIGLYEGRVFHTLIRWQLVVMYAGAFVNKLFDPDWRSGVYFDFLLIDITHNTGYTALAAELPGHTLGIAMSWSTIVIETVLAVCFVLPHRPRWWLAAAALGCAFHGMSVFMTGTTFGIYVPAVVLAYFLAFPMPRPGEPRLELPGGGLFGRLIRWLDLDRIHGLATTGGVRPSLHFDGWTLYGWRARLAALIYLPTTWVALGVVLLAIRQVKILVLG